MGGINHQPCNRPGTAYLRFSVLMSRALSNARASIDKANVNLEDVLLREMGHEFGTGTLADVAACLGESDRYLHHMKLAVGLLRKNMKENDFVDLHKLLGLDPEKVATDFTESSIINYGAETLRAVAVVLKVDGFYEMLDVFESRADHLRGQTAKLVDGFKKLQPSEAKGEVTQVLEGNLPGNIRAEFARLYSDWNKFHQIFLASSVLSTEIWYRWIKAGSLITGPQTQAAVA